MPFPNFISQVGFFFFFWQGTFLRNSVCLEHTLGNADRMTKSADFGVIQTWIQILILPLNGCVIFDKSLTLSEPQFLLFVK